MPPNIQITFSQVNILQKIIILLNQF